MPRIIQIWNSYMFEQLMWYGSCMSNLVQNKRSNHITSTLNEHCICRADNITIMTMYHTNDSLSYHVARCNYCREEWAEYWVVIDTYSLLLYPHVRKSQKQCRMNCPLLVNHLLLCIKNIEIELEFNGSLNLNTNNFMGYWEKVLFKDVW